MLTLPASALRAARAAAAVAWATALAGVVLAVHHPLVLAAGAAVVAGAALLAGAGRATWRTVRIALPFALFMALVNGLIVRDGLTVLLRLGTVPPFGQLDVTAEALAYGLLEGGRICVVAALLALVSAAVDPDEVLRGLRRVSFRSALTAALAVRLVPVLARDARRMAVAQRCRADGGGSRVLVLRALAGSALDRALDVASTLEVRGYAAATPGRRARRPWSRHDRAFLASALAVVLLGVALARLSAFETYPRIGATEEPGAWVVAGLVVVAALLPFADRKGIER